MIRDEPNARRQDIEQADGIFESLTGLVSVDARFAITVAGDAGAGNSDLTHEIHGLLNAHNIQAGSFQQDDYSFFPSSTNHRLCDRKLQQIGTYEVRVDSHVVDMLEQEHQVLSKYKSPSDPAIPCDSSRVESGERRK